MIGREKTKHWCFTINNPVLDDVKVPEVRIEYMIIGYEIGERGTPHLQGYVCIDTRVYLNLMKVWLPRAHLERMRGTPLEALNYCKKDNIWSERGQIPVNGGIVAKRNYDQAFEYAKEGHFDMIPKSLLIQHYHAFKRIKQDYPASTINLDKCTGIWIVGPPGSGKSTVVRETWLDLYDKPANKWWDGYQNQKNVLIDDFDKNHKVLGHHMKRWADKFSFPAEMKGTTVQIRPEKIIITSNYLIEDIFTEDEILQQAINRRFQTIRFVILSCFKNVIPDFVK